MPLLVAEAAERVVIAVPRDKLAAAIKAVSESGCLHPVSVNVSPVLRRLRGDVEALESRLREVVRHLTTITRLEGEAGVVEVGVGRDVEQSLGRLLSMVEELASSIEKLVSRYVELTSPDSDLYKAIQLAELYSFIEANLSEAARGKFLRATLYRVPVDRVEAFTRELSSLGHEVVVVVVEGVEDRYALVATAYPTELEEKVAKAAMTIRASPLRLPEGLPQSPFQLVEAVKQELESLPKRITGELPRLQRALTILEAARRMLALLEAVTATRLVAFIHGYTLPEDLERLRTSLEQAVNGAFTITVVSQKEHVHREEVMPPSHVTVSSRLKPFLDTLALYGYPRPGELVPLLIMVVTLPVIYGLMFPDLGHGLVLVLAGLVFYKKLGWKDLGKFVVILGIAACVAGFLAGEFFGPHPAVSGWLSALWNDNPPYASPLHAFSLHLSEVLEGKVPMEVREEAVHVLYRVIHLSLLLGTLLLTVSSACSIVNGMLFRDREMLVAGLGKTLAFGGALLAFAAPLAIAAEEPLAAAARILGAAALGMSVEPGLAVIAQVVRYMALLGLLLTFLAPLVLGHGGFGERFTMGFMEFFDLIIMLLGNTASFLRIMGIMLAHSGVMFGFTVVALMAGNPAAQTVIYALGNLLVIGLESIVAYAHTLRLHFYEMFSKFYMDGGTPYSPLRMPENIVLKVEA